MPFQHDYADSTQVVLLGMESATDREGWQKARDEGFVIVTRDADMALTSQTNRINPRDQAVFPMVFWPPSRRQTGIFRYEFQTIGVCPQLAPALLCGAEVLFTEDMQSGMRIDGLTLQNPFLPDQP